MSVWISNFRNMLCGVARQFTRRCLLRSGRNPENITIVPHCHPVAKWENIVGWRHYWRSLIQRWIVRSSGNLSVFNDVAYGVNENQPPEPHRDTVTKRESISYRWFEQQWQSIERRTIRPAYWNLGIHRFNENEPRQTHGDTASEWQSIGDRRTAAEDYGTIRSDDRDVGFYRFDDSS